MAPPAAADGRAQAPATDDLRGQQDLRALIEDTLRDLQAGRPDLPPVTAASSLDRDLGLDSLARTELLMRIERAFGVELPEDTLQRAETVGDLWLAMHRGVAGARPGRPSTDAVDAVRRADVAARDVAPSGDVLAEAATLLEVFDWHCREHPDQVQHIVLQDHTEEPVTYRQLADAASAVAAGLQHRGIAARECVAIMLPTSADYFRVYLGILMAGAIPVPIYPPTRPSQLEDHVMRHAAILANARAVGMVTVEEGRNVARLLQSQVDGLRWVATPAQLAQHGSQPVRVKLRAQDIAFIQYTSGSTGQPKGVALTHANLLANIRAMAHVVQATPRDVFVSWLPLYHDMGLIGAWLGSLMVGYLLVVMSPLTFLARPVRWLQAIDRWGGTLSAGPNFAYELCLKRIEDAELKALDLSSWRLAFNGAEAVSPDTVQQFSARFAACGLRPETMTPVYGLAEASVGLLFPPPGRRARIDSIDRDTFAREHRAVPVPPDQPGALRFVACGRVIPDHAVRIVDESGQEVGERLEGRLEFQGPSATQGYFRNPAQTAQLMHNGWLDTGDRAYRADGDIVITGRVKDIVIRGGRNLYPQEIEEAVGLVDGIRRGCVAVFGSPDPATGTERLVVMAETRRVSGQDRAVLHDAVTRAVSTVIGEPPDDVVLVPPHTVLKTSSGKVRRSACRQQWESGIAAPPAGAGAQLLKLTWLALRARAGALARQVVAALQGLRIVAFLALIAPATWLLTLGTRSAASAWRIGGRAARGWLRLSGLPLEVRGLEHLPQRPCVLVSNHASYLDGLILVAALPRPLTFIAKRELQTQQVAGRYLQRLGAMFVERTDARRSVADAERMVHAVQQGQSLAVFAEGTFVASPGLLPFHLGAFLTAVRAGVPVVPVTIAGTRTVLPEDARWPRRAPLCVTVGRAIEPAADGADAFAAAVRLRDATRDVISRTLEA